MPNHLVTDCVNCGKQVILSGEGPGERCYWCEKPALKKEVKTVTLPANNTKPELPPVPSETTTKPSAKERALSYRKHKREMIEDLIALGNQAFLEKWKVHGSIISHLKSDPLYKSKQDGKAPADKQPEHDTKLPKNDTGKPSLATKVEKSDHLVSLGTFKVEVANELPDFPAFNPKWKKQVQLKWLEIYGELARK